MYTASLLPWLTVQSKEYGDCSHHIVLTWSGANRLGYRTRLAINPLFSPAFTCRQGSRASYNCCIVIATPSTFNSALRLHSYPKDTDVNACSCQQFKVQPLLIDPRFMDNHHLTSERSLLGEHVFIGGSSHFPLSPLLSFISILINFVYIRRI